MIRLLVATILAVGVPAGAQAEWTSKQRANFLESCIEGCVATPNLSEQGKRLCTPACNCVADEGERIMTPADMDAAEKAAAENKSTAKLDELDKVYPLCVKRASGAR